MNRGRSVIELNIVNFITIGLIALVMMALARFIGKKFNIDFLASA